MFYYYKLLSLDVLVVLWLILLILLSILVIDLNGTLLDTNYTNLILYKDVLSNKFGMSHLIELL